ncbi:MFS transporter [Corynebacterium efficiens]|uniref:Putative glucuronide carrier protein n=1 Tax=Corynebacterium efficiens (strain DSM 44549 / YS-314 / AJ 12310 / JCM 11189 / NBRC 100395) TaxID=196164 RepID=Q8FMW8_COREF|nr:putative glucuronide carrier protein [Corynebacterium efficiens YS-314]
MSTKTSSPVKAGKPGQGQMPGHRVLTYSFGDVANNFSFMMTSMFLMVYMTDIVGLSAGVAGAIYGITKIWAGCADLIAGNTVDRTNSRWGRLRPYLLFGPAPLAIVFVALFSTPANMSMTATIAWIFIFDALYQLAYSFINIPYGSLASSMTQDPVDRSKLSGSRAIASALASVALAWVVSPQFQDTEADGIRLKFTITCIILAVILYLICFANSREVVPRAAGSISFKQTFTMLKQNRPLQILLLVALLFLTANFVFNAVALCTTSVRSRVTQPTSSSCSWPRPAVPSCSPPSPRLSRVDTANAPVICWPPYSP